MMDMIILALVLLGLCLGSFVNALVWRLHEQGAGKEPRPGGKPAAKVANELSITRGRSMCPACRHGLAVKDLIPLFSWLWLHGKCRYCGQPISKQYPLVELATALSFVALYIWWPVAFSASQVIIFGLWLLLLTGLMALVVYDLRWMLLPNRLIYPLAGIAIVIAVVAAMAAPRPAVAVLNDILAVAVGGGVFYALFQVSKGKWIGGGDVKLGWVLGLVTATPARAGLMIFLAALVGTLASLPLLAIKRAKRNTIIPFGPFLILAAVIVQLFGHDILNWYQSTFLPYTL